MSNPGTIEFMAADALRRGDVQAARNLYEKLVAQGTATASTWLGLAHVHRALDAHDAALAAVDRAIVLDPQNLRALLFKADHMSQIGDDRVASSFYTAALRHASTLSSLPPEIVEGLKRAKAMRERYARQFEDHLSSKLAAAQSGGTKASRRFGQSLDLLFGRKQLYFQQPTQYFFPELPQIQFYDRAEFEWVKAIEAATGDIRTELEAVLRDGTGFQAYVESAPNRPPPPDRSMTDNKDWSAFFLWKEGAPIADHVARCPKTARAVENAPLCRIHGRAPSIYFSLLRPGTRIPAHTGYVNTRLICHLPLIVPPKCLFRVGNDVRAWRQGELLLFDDTVEHEARNDSTETRVVLIFDIWRPELTRAECDLVAATIEAIGSYGIS